MLKNGGINALNTQKLIPQEFFLAVFLFFEEIITMDNNASNKKYSNKTENKANNRTNNMNSKVSNETSNRASNEANNRVSNAGNTTDKARNCR